MGRIFYAVNDRGEAYELGKSGWMNLCDDPDANPRMITPRGVDAILERITSSVIVGPGWRADVVADLSYHRRIAEDLAALGAPLRLVFDEELPENPDDMFKVVGTRYLRE